MASRKNRSNDTPDKKLSKFLSYLLRHGAEKEGFTLQAGGFLYVEDILTHKNAEKFSIADIERVVISNDKQRFFMEKEPGTNRYRIRANQGHSVEVKDLELEEIVNPEDFPVVLHGTYNRCWDSIKSKGLSIMKRTHIHFAAGQPGQSGVISGMRSSCDLLIYINLEKALKDGIKFYLSANGVILSSGNEQNLIPFKYFERVVKRRTGQEVSF